MVNIEPVTAEIFLILTNVTRTNVDRKNITITVGSQDLEGDVDDVEEALGEVLNRAQGRKQQLLSTTKGGGQF